MNWALTIVILVLLVLGVMFIYSACFISDDQPVRSLYLKQAQWMTVGILCYLLFAFYDYRRLRPLAPFLYVLSVGLLFAVLIVGEEIGGSRRWLPVIPSMGIGIQPSELAKLSVILLSASLLGAVREKRAGRTAALMVVLLAALPVILVAREPDVGTAAVFVPTVFIMLFVAGMSWKKMFLFAASASVLAGMVVTLVVYPQRLGISNETAATITESVGLRDYHRRRLAGFMEPGKDPLGAGWNKMQSEIAVGSGGRWGKGWRRGDQNILGYLPRSVAPTDFIYSVIAEETGFAGSAMVLFLFGLVIVFGMHTALKARDRMGRLLCAGLVTMVFSHAFVNIAMAIGCLPITGLPLPFLSYGGTFMVATMSAMGIVQSVYIRSRPRVRSLQP